MKFFLNVKEGVDYLPHMLAALHCSVDSHAKLHINVYIMGQGMYYETHT